jgi:hypothetical protein
VAALEGAGILPLADVGPPCDKGLVIPLPALEDFNNAFIMEAGHEAAESEVDGGGTGFPVDKRVDGVKFLVLESLVENIPDKRRKLVVFIEALLELAVGAGMGSITVHWSVGECVRAAGAGEHGRVATQRQGPKGQNNANREERQGRATCRLK